MNESTDEKRGKSPAYPFFNVAVAATMAKTLYKKTGNRGALKEAVVEIIGYKSVNGASLSALSTLKKFGLVKYVNNRIMLTEDGVALSIYPESDERYKAVLKRVALNHPLYKNLYERYALPDDPIAIKAELLNDGYRHDKIDSIIKHYKKSMVSAGLNGPDIENENGQEDELDFSDDPKSNLNEEERQPALPLRAMTTAATNQTRKEVPIVMPDGEQEIILSFPQPHIRQEDLEEIRDWVDYMEKKLKRNKPANLLDEEQ